MWWGDECGQIPQAVFDELKNSVELIKNLGADHDDGEYVAAMARFYRAKVAADSAASHLDEGYYQIVPAQMRKNAFLFSPNDGTLHWTPDEKTAADNRLADNGYPMTIFHVQKQSSGGAFSLQCLYDSLYWQPASGYNERVQMATVRPTAPLFVQHCGKGQLSVYSPLQINNEVAECHYMYTTKDGNLIESSRTSMQLLLQSVATDGIDSLRAAALQTRLDARLASLLDTARLQLQQAVIYENDPYHADVAAAAQELQRAAGQAATVPPRQCTMADVNTLQAALNGVWLVWPDTTRLEALCLEAADLEADASVGTAIGQTRQSAIDSLRVAVNAATALRPYTRLRRPAIDTATARLVAAIEVYQQSINMPLATESYFIVSASDGTMRGRCIVTGQYESGRLLSLEGTTGTNEQNVLAAWQFVPMGERGVYAIRSLGSGLYMGACNRLPIALSDTPAPYRLRLVGRGLLGLQGEESEWFLSHGNGGPVGKDRFTAAEHAWTLQAVDHDRMTDIKYLHPQSAQVVCVPYATTQLPTSLYADMQWYEPLGLQVDATDCITGLALRLTDDESLRPGKPYVLVMGRSVESDDDDLAVDMCLDVDNPRQDTLLTAYNGLHGTLRSLTFTTPGYAYFSRSDTLHFTTETDEVVLPPHGGYFRRAALQPVRGAAHLVLPVERGHTLADIYDHNGDGRVGLADVVVLIDRVAGARGDDALLSDHNDDGLVNLSDAIIVLRQVSGE